MREITTYAYYVSYELQPDSKPQHLQENQVTTHCHKGGRSTGEWRLPAAANVGLFSYFKYFLTMLNHFIYTYIIVPSHTCTLNSISHQQPPRYGSLWRRWWWRTAVAAVCCCTRTKREITRITFTLNYSSRRLVLPSDLRRR